MKLIYVMDPQCGWCYGNGKNIKAIKEKFSQHFDIDLMVGGMWLGNNAPVGGDGFANFIEVNGGRLSQTTGAPLGKPFLELCKDSSYTFSSLEGAAAIIWVLGQNEEKAFSFAKRSQEQFFLEGLRYDKVENYRVLLEELNLDYSRFQEEWLSDANLKATKAHFAKAASLANGFPALLLEKEGKLMSLASGYFNAAQMEAQLQSLIK